jgi:uncharacterized protein YydD (DUF2326 family)
MRSKGRNQGRVLVYDLSVLFFNLDRIFPKFLVHDGIFDGVDKAHFVALYEYIENQKQSGKRFQYIITLNEEGNLTEKFGPTDKVSTEKIETEAVLVLTPTKKLFNKPF